MNRSLTLILTTLALLGGVADAGRRSGGGFGGSRGSTYSAPRTPTYRAPAPAPTPRYTPPANTSTGSTYTRPSTTPNTTKANTRSTLPSTSSVRSSAANRAAAAKVTPMQLSQWNKVKLPAGVPRDAITYSATASSRYQYQLQPGRYYPYPQSYYRQNNLGYDILKYALIFTAVSSIADAVTPDVVAAAVSTNAPVVVQQPQPAQQPQGPNLWTYVGVGFFAAAAGWFLLGGRRR